ncbi:MAG: homocysteine S-methyltransferase family protein [Alphaproteobacteria bacterium]|nr:homocysteine S-methyltransferase family protein [Alphaproteobacteria bacterium]
MTAVTLLDGGLGQEINLRSDGPATALWSVEVMMSRPDIVEAVHQDFIKAGADAITVNAYTATRSRLARNGHPEWFEDAQANALKLARKARADSGADIQITGCLPPLVASYVTELAEDYDNSFKAFEEIVAVQQDGVDVMFIETIGLIAEANAGIDAAKASGKPVYVSFTLNDDSSNTLRSGEKLEDAVAEAAARGVDGIMVNCSIPEAVTVAMPVLATGNCRFGGYANGFTSIEKLVPGGNVDALKARTDLDPAAYGNFVSQWLDAGASIIGGCCEVGPAHIAYLDQMLKDAGVKRQKL